MDRGRRHSDVMRLPCVTVRMKLPNCNCDGQVVETVNLLQTSDYCLLDPSETPGHFSALRNRVQTHFLLLNCKSRGWMWSSCTAGSLFEQLSGISAHLGASPTNQVPFNSFLCPNPLLFSSATVFWSCLLFFSAAANGCFHLVYQLDGQLVWRCFQCQGYWQKYRFYLRFVVLQCFKNRTEKARCVREMRAAFVEPLLPKPHSRSQLRVKVSKSRRPMWQIGNLTLLGGQNVIICPDHISKHLLLAWPLEDNGLVSCRQETCSNVKWAARNHQHTNIWTSSTKPAGGPQTRNVTHVTKSESTRSTSRSMYVASNLFGQKVTFEHTAKPEIAKAKKLQAWDVTQAKITILLLRSIRLQRKGKQNF